MSKQAPFQKILFREMKYFISPILDYENDLEAVLQLFSSFGWNLESLLGTNTSSFLSQVNTVINTTNIISGFIDNPPNNINELSKAIGKLDDVSKSLQNLKLNLPEITNFDWDDLVKDTINGLTIFYLSRYPKLYKTLLLLTVIEYENQEVIRDSDGNIKRIKGYLPKVKLTKISKFINKPEDVFREAYFSSGFDSIESVNQIAVNLFPRVGSFLKEFGVIYHFGSFPVYSLDVTEEEQLRHEGMLTFRKEFEDYENQKVLEVGTTIGLLEKAEGGPGVFLSPFGELASNFILNNWLLSIDAAGAISGFKIVKNGFSFFDGNSSGNFSFQLEKIKDPNGGKAFSFGSSDSILFEIEQVDFYGHVRLEDKYQEYLIGFHLLNSLLNISPPKEDGFLSNVLPEEGLSASFDLSLGWSSLDGLFFDGSAGLELLLPVNVNLKPVFLKDILISIQAANEGIGFSLGVNVNIDLNPVLFSLGDFGVKTELEFKENSNLGLLEFVSPTYKIPNQIGIKINSEALSGGGFLSIDNDRYAGFLTLHSEALELSALGLIQTKLPNNKEGFSMLVSINAVFGKAIPLAFGFKLKGVGGLVGIHRRIAVDVLRSRIETGSIDSIMFPENLLENADRVLSDLEAVFPTEKNHHVIAPFLLLEWGSKSLVEFEIGVLIEFPFKNRILLLGSLNIYLPQKEYKEGDEIIKPQAEIHVDVLGDLNFAERYIRLDGRLRNSYIREMKLKGGFAFILSTGRNPQFLLSLGGYHPRYKKPERFPDLERLGAYLTREDKELDTSLSLSCETYLAITSNSFQVGFNAELVARRKEWSVRGYLGFDTFIQFDPFYFEAEIRMGVSIRRKKKELFGVDLYFFLSGPKPWYIKGYARIKILFIKGKVRFELEWGGKKQKAIPQTIKHDELQKQLVEQLQSANNWTAELSDNFTSAEILRPIDVATEGIVLHPSGYLEVRQTALPLKTSINKYGNAYVVNKDGIIQKETQFGIKNIKLGEEEVTADNTLKEYFSRGQFEELTDKEKLSIPDFELFDAGYQFREIDNKYIDFGGHAEKDNAYKNDMIGEEDIPQDVQARRLRNQEPQTQKVNRNIAAATNSSRIKRFKAQTREAFRLSNTQPIIQSKEGYYIVSKKDFEKHKDIIFPSKIKAMKVLKKNKSLRRYYQIMKVSEYELLREPVAQ